jgi:hypothetical protein
VRASAATHSDYTTNNGCPGKSAAVAAFVVAAAAIGCWSPAVRRRARWTGVLAIDQARGVVGRGFLLGALRELRFRLLFGADVGGIKIDSAAERNQNL